MEKGTVMRLCPFAWALPPMPLSPVSHSRGMHCRPLARDVGGGGVAWLCVWAANSAALSVQKGVASNDELPLHYLFHISQTLPFLNTMVSNPVPYSQMSMSS